MRLCLRALAALLGYPSAELAAHIPDIRAALAAGSLLPPDELGGLEPLLQRLGSQDLLDAQVEYTELFDRSRALSLHLFEHVHGDSRDRGPAIIDLGQQYLDKGFMLEGPELPDFVPVFIEFASCLSAPEAREMLGEPAHVFAALEERLVERGSDYAPVFGAVLALAGAHPDAEALDELREQAPSDDPAQIDEEWEEKAVTFTAPHEMGGPTGIVAKIRAAGKAATAARTGTKG
ncbi:nitrate reductase molybdenum cofactor assembly chaperone [Paracoccus rhizosphaerae]|uniref:Nitrate reductase molybdenum cofactor assembly chaperone n=1 Tax=Paracoccus rhizosphaerae TaxID=1133347 RepID=A0ABV6CFR2_9RHOB|nr:nitrate reductase molybdenum cofactor assembly chaperone [Paracoccus rhizosphaerae]